MKTTSKNSSYKFLEIKNRNIFDSALSRINAGSNGSSVIIAHVCNNVNSFGGGFAKELATVFPIAKENFHMLGNKSKLGQVQTIMVAENKIHRHKLYICNMIAQNNTMNIKNPRPLNYIALAHCMNSVKIKAQELSKITENDKIEIHSPRFGSGLAGGNWSFIADMIDDAWTTNMGVYIYSI